MSKAWENLGGSKERGHQPSVFDRSKKSSDARILNVKTFRDAERARRGATLQTLIERHRIEQVRESGLSLADEAGSVSPIALVFAGVALGGAAILSACGGGSADNPTNSPNPETGTPVATAVKPTEKPTAAPTVTEKPLWGPAPTFGKVQDAINSAFATIDTSKLADPLNKLGEFNKYLRWCNGQIDEPIDVPADQLGMSLVASCAALGQTLVRLYDDNKADAGKAELFKAAVYAGRDFTMGQVDKYAADKGQRMPPDLDAYKKAILDSSFTIVK